MLQSVASRRCIGCHKSSPRREWVRITNPEFNAFLIGPLAQAAGGAQACGKPIFASTDDPDYQAILRTFDPIRDTLGRNPRMDMPKGRPAPGVCRDTK